MRSSGNVPFIKKKNLYETENVPFYGNSDISRFLSNYEIRLI